MRQIIKNGTIVTGGGSFPADILIDGEKIAATGTAEEIGKLTQPGDREIDAAGCLIFPGFIDIFILPAGILRYLIQIFYSISFVNSAATFINKISILTICHPYCLCSCFRLCPGRNGQPQKQRKQQHDHHYIFLLTTHLSYLASQSIIT